MPRSHNHVSPVKRCSHPGCSRAVKNHRWGQIKADSWFFSKDGVHQYCPDHIPEWVEAWRARKRNDS